MKQLPVFTLLPLKRPRASEQQPWRAEEPAPGPWGKQLPSLTGMLEPSPSPPLQAAVVGAGTEEVNVHLPPNVNVSR